MTKEQQINQIKERIKVLTNSRKDNANIVNKLNRKLRKLENE